MGIPSKVSNKALW